MSIKILIAEDDFGIREMLQLTFSFEEEAYDIRFAEDGQQAIELCRDFAPDVIVTDSLLPVFTGEQVVRACSSTEVAVVSFSGLDGRPEWADHVISKGDPDALERLKTVLAEEAARRK